jgi:hypothetical protein
MIEKNLMGKGPYVGSKNRFRWLYSLLKISKHFHKNFELEKKQISFGTYKFDFFTNHFLDYLNLANFPIL